MIALASPQLHSIDEVIHGEALAVLRTLPDNSVDAIVCDPPAGISFMGKQWDNYSGKSLPNREQEKKDDEAAGKWMQGRGTLPYGFGATTPTVKERDAFISSLTLIMAEALRVLKPGGHAFVWALPRTSHWTGIALEDAGFEVRDVITHLFGSGFPKSHDISVAIDRMAGTEREVVGKSNRHGGGTLSGASWNIPVEVPDITAPATPEAAQWDGWGTALKPACEHWYLVRKPLSEKSIAANVLEWGVGAINIDASRVGYVSEQDKQHSARPGHEGRTSTANIFSTTPHMHGEQSTQGRWPANLLLSHSSLPVLGLRERIPLQIEETIRRYYSDYDRVQILRERVPNVSNQTKAQSGKILQSSMQRHSPKGDDRRVVSSLWDTPHAENERCDCPECKKSQSEIGQTSELEGRELHTGGVSTSPLGYISGRDTTDRRSYADQSRLCIGAPSSDGDAFGQTSEIIGVCTSHEREQVGQPDRELNDNGRCSTLETSQGNRKKISRDGRGKSTLEVLANDIPDEWLQYFREVGNLGCVPNGVKKVRGNGGVRPDKPIITDNSGIRDHGWGFGPRVGQAYNDSEGMEQVEDWLCDESCPVRLLDEQSGMRKSGGMAGKRYQNKSKGGATTNFGTTTIGNYCGAAISDEGGASRYFQRFAYIPKASRAERNRGCEGLPEVTTLIGASGHKANPSADNKLVVDVPRQNTHPTVKPLALCRYLVRMITPPGGIVLDCFAGSGSTLVAAIHEGMHFIGIEMNDTQDEPYVTIARARIEQAFREVQP